MWKEIPIETNYEVSVDGEVRSKKTKKLKGLRYDRGGYLRVTLYPSGKTYSIHRLVAITFLENDKSKPLVNHKNGVKDDNRLHNLEWSTHRENVLHAYKNNLNQYRKISGEKNPSVKLNWAKVKEIRDLHKKGKPIQRIAEEFGVQYNCIKRIVKNITWK